MTRGVLVLGCALLFAAQLAQADGVVTCLDGVAGGALNSCKVSWGCHEELPAADTLVRAVDAAGAHTWQGWSALPSSATVRTCKLDGTAGSWSTKALAGVTVTGSAPPQPPQGPVALPAPGTLEVSWTAPTANVDGTPLANITGYRVEFGPTQALGQMREVANVLRYTLTGLAGGTWYVAVRTLTASTHSAPSEIASGIVTVPAPVDCVVGAWSAWVTGSWSACASGMRARTDSRARTVVTPAAHGGTCPALTETRSVTEACEAEPPWTVAATSTGRRPVYEAVANLDGTALVRGTVQGSIAVGALCGAQVLRVGSASYRDVNEADMVLNSPSYRGRRHIAICAMTSP